MRCWLLLYLLSCRYSRQSAIQTHIHTHTKNPNIHAFRMWMDAVAQTHTSAGKTCRLHTGSLELVFKCQTSICVANMLITTSLCCPRKTEKGQTYQEGTTWFAQRYSQALLNCSSRFVYISSRNLWLDFQFPWGPEPFFKFSVQLHF